MDRVDVGQAKRGCYGRILLANGRELVEEGQRFKLLCNYCGITEFTRILLRNYWITRILLRKVLLSRLLNFSSLERRLREYYRTP